MDTVKKKDQSKADREAYRNCWMIRRELGDVQGIGCVQLTEKTWRSVNKISLSLDTIIKDSNID